MRFRSNGDKVQHMVEYDEMLKVHLTPKIFFAKTNPLIFCGISVQKFSDLVKSSIFCALLKYGKSV